MYAIIRLFGSYEDQMRYHNKLRKPLMEILDTGVISRFVLTYHGDCLYLCLDSERIQDCTFEAIQGLDGLRPITEVIEPLWQNGVVKASHYEVEVRESIRKQAIQKGFENLSNSMLTELTERQIDNASRGSTAALKILLEGPSDIKNWYSLVLKVHNYCKPLSGGWIISDSVHFCFNSLAIDGNKENLITELFHTFNGANRIVNDLFSRESWSMDSKQVNLEGAIECGFEGD